MEIKYFSILPKDAELYKIPFIEIFNEKILARFNFGGDTLFEIIPHSKIIVKEDKIFGLTQYFCKNVELKKIANVESKKCLKTIFNSVKIIPEDLDLLFYHLISNNRIKILKNMFKLKLVKKDKLEKLLIFSFLFNNKKMIKLLINEGAEILLDKRRLKNILKMDNVNLIEKILKKSF